MLCRLDKVALRMMSLTSIHSNFCWKHLIQGQKASLQLRIIPVPNFASGRCDIYKRYN